MKLLKKVFILLLFIFIFTYNNQACVSYNPFENEEEVPYCDGDDCGFNEGITKVGGKINDLETDKKASVYFQDVVIYLVGFLYLIAVVLIIYSGFNILISVGEEEKIKKSKDIIKYTLIGLIVVFLANAIIQFILNVLTEGSSPTE